MLPPRAAAVSVRRNVRCQEHPTGAMSVTRPRRPSGVLAARGGRGNIERHESGLAIGRASTRDPLKARYGLDPSRSHGSSIARPRYLVAVSGISWCRSAVQNVLEVLGL